MSDQLDQEQTKGQSEESRDIMRRITLGLDMQQMLRSNVGRHLITRAEEERAATLEKFKSVDPENPKAIRNLQCELAVIDKLQQWMADAVADGDQAEKIIEESQD